jgi:hypothetical protein
MCRGSFINKHRNHFLTKTQNIFFHDFCHKMLLLREDLKKIKLQYFQIRCLINDSPEYLSEKCFFRKKYRCVQIIIQIKIDEKPLHNGAIHRYISQGR